MWFNNNFSTGKNIQVRMKMNKPYLLFWLDKILRKIFSHAVVKLPIKYIKFVCGCELFTVASDIRGKKSLAYNLRNFDANKNNIFNSVAKKKKQKL